VAAVAAMDENVFRLRREVDALIEMMFATLQLLYIDDVNDRVDRVRALEQKYRGLIPFTE
jgi:hypothetical protein